MIVYSKIDLIYVRSTCIDFELQIVFHFYLIHEFSIYFDKNRKRKSVEWKYFNCYFCLNTRSTTSIERNDLHFTFCVWEWKEFLRYLRERQKEKEKSLIPLCITIDCVTFLTPNVWEVSSFCGFCLMLLANAFICLLSDYNASILALLLWLKILSHWWKFDLCIQRGFRLNGSYKSWWKNSRKLF